MTFNQYRFQHRLRCIVIHPLDDDCNILLSQLRRIGCLCTNSWPAPDNIEDDIDVVFYAVNQNKNQIMDWDKRERTYALIGLVSYETPQILEALINANVQGIITKPIRNFGVLAHLVNARALHQYETRLVKKIDKLDSNLRSRRKVEKATAIIAKKNNVSEEEAYSAMRRGAMNKQISVEVMADSIINTNDFFSKN